MGARRGANSADEHEHEAEEGEEEPLRSTSLFFSSSPPLSPPVVSPRARSSSSSAAAAAAAATAAAATAALRPLAAAADAPCTSQQPTPAPMSPRLAPYSGNDGHGNCRVCCEAGAGTHTAYPLPLLSVLSRMAAFTLSCQRLGLRV